MAYRQHFPKTHRCLAPDCQKEVPNKHLMCWDHWKLLPGALQTLIVEQWAYGLKNHCHPCAEYINAVAQAQQFIRAKQAPLMAAARASSTLLPGGAA